MNEKYEKITVAQHERIIKNLNELIVLHVKQIKTMQELKQCHQHLLEKARKREAE